MKQQYLHVDEFAMRQEDDGRGIKRWFYRMAGAWKLFLISILICLTAAFFYLKFVTPIYLAVASLMVKDETKGSELIDDTRLKEVGLTGNSKLVVNEIEILKSYDLMEKVVDSLQLFASVKRVSEFRDVAVYGDDLPFRVEILNPEKIIKPLRWMIAESGSGLLFRAVREDKPVPLGYDAVHEANGIQFICKRNDTAKSQDGSFENGEEKYTVDVLPVEATVLQYSKRLSVEPANKMGTVINLELKDTNKKRAEGILKTLLVIYDGRSASDRNRVTAKTINFLNDRLAEVANELHAVEGSVEKFKSENKVTTLSSDAEQYLAISQQVDAEKAEKQTQLNIISALEQDLEANANNPQLVPSTYGIRDESLGQLIQKYNEVVLHKERVEQRSGPKNPLLIDLQNQTKELRGRLLTNVKNLKQAYQISLNDILKKDMLMNNQIRKVPEMEKKLVQVTRVQNVQEQLYSYLLQKREEAAVSRASNIEDFKIIVNARELGAVSPKTNLVWAVSLFLGFVFPIAFIGIRDLLNNKVGDAAQVRQHTDVPLLGVISHVKKRKSAIVIHSGSRSAVAEQLRNIRTAINFSGRTAKTIMVTSFQPGDGKSFVSLNLAAGYALLGKKTIMLEFDLRRPHVSKDLGLNGQEGITSILSGKCSLDELLVEVESHKGYLYVLPAGDVSLNPAELISGRNMSWFFKLLRDRFDYIIINTPPVSLVTDAALLEAFADMTLIVIRQDHTSREVYGDLNQRAAKHADKPIYLVLNDVGKRKFYETSYSSKYTYGSGKGYYADE